MTTPSLHRIPHEGDAADRLLDSIVRRALASGASDVHLTPGGSRGTRVLYRIHGRLGGTEEILPAREASLFAGRLKVLAGLNIAEKRRPQEGAVRLASSRGELELRLSFMPCLDGESIAIRVLQERDPWVLLGDLGMDARTRTRLESISGSSSGVLLVVGPTGSGKTTTLYAMAREIARRGRRLISVEDPIERRLEDVVQVSVRQEDGFGFPEALRGALRHDPDVILVGEVRDPDTAALVLSAGLSGHLVLASMHAAGPRSALARLIHFGVDRRNLAGILEAILSQRLVREPCEPCSGERCEKCHGNGAGGRRGIFQLLELDEPERSRIAAGDQTACLSSDVEALEAGGTAA